MRFPLSLSVSLSLSLPLLLSSASPLPPVPAKCERYTACNGQMCDEICKIGTVELDAWSDQALSFQRGLQFNLSLLEVEMIGTHNGAIAQDYVMGIEEKFLHELLLPVYGERRSDVVIANQRHSLLDQLRMGVRHLEVDVYHRLGELRICHWPVFPPDFVFLVNRAAKEQGLYPLDWEPTNMGCDENKPLMQEKLREIRSWMDMPENRQEFVGIYLDNKNVRERHIDQFTSEFLEVFGDILFTPEHKRTEYPDTWPSIAELVSKNRRVYLENGDESWEGNPTADKYFFTPRLWVQFGPDAFKGHPSCTVNGNDYYNRELTRSLDGSLTLGPAFLWEGRTDYPPETIVAMAACSINIQSMDQVYPEMMRNFVWSWEEGEPSRPQGCAVMGREGRWRVEDCGRELPHACVSPESKLEWVLGSNSTWGSGSCPQGTSFSLPRTGISNTYLASLAGGQEVWLNHSL